MALKRERDWKHWTNTVMTGPWVNHIINVITITFGLDLFVYHIITNVILITLGLDLFVCLFVNHIITHVITITQ